MKTREEYMEEAEIWFDAANESPMSGMRDGSSTYCATMALAYATMAVAARPDDVIHYYPHKIIERLSWRDEKLANDEAKQTLDEMRKANRQGTTERYMDR